MEVEILITNNEVSLETLNKLAAEWHGMLVKGVADVERNVLALGGEWHMDANNALIADGSKQENLWGFNVYQDETGESALEYISLINIRPAQGNTDMELKDVGLREAIKSLVGQLIPVLKI